MQTANRSKFSARTCKAVMHKVQPTFMLFFLPTTRASGAFAPLGLDYLNKLRATRRLHAFRQ
jgi:hypothetical protein